MNTPRTEVCCVCCGEIGRHHARGLRSTCYNQHLAAGTLDQYPVFDDQLPARWRRETFAELRARKLSIRKAAEQVGVSKRTGERYAAQLKTTAAA